jgi:hypothetical protein
VLGIRPAHAGERLGIGSAYHAGLEALNRGGTIDAAVAAARAVAANDIDRERVACMVAGWHWRWSEAPAFRKVLATEQVFEFVLRDDRTYAGKIDVIGELADGRVAVGEYKTASEDLSAGEGRRGKRRGGCYLEGSDDMQRRRRGGCTDTDTRILDSADTIRF